MTAMMVLSRAVTVTAAELLLAVGHPAVVGVGAVVGEDVVAGVDVGAAADVRMAAAAERGAGGKLFPASLAAAVQAVAFPMQIHPKRLIFRLPPLLLLLLLSNL